MNPTQHLRNVDEKTKKNFRIITARLGLTQGQAFKAIVDAFLKK